MSANAADVDLLQQALTNSGLSNGTVDGSGTASVTVTITLPDGIQKDTSISADEQLTLAPSRPTRQTISTMAVHDSVTGQIRRHAVRKVVLCMLAMLLYMQQSGELLT